MYVLDSHIKFKQEMQYICIFLYTGNKWSRFYNEATFISLHSVFNWKKTIALSRQSYHL